MLFTKPGDIGLWSWVEARGFQVQGLPGLSDELQTIQGSLMRLSLKFKNQNQNKRKAEVYSSVMEHVLSMGKAMGSILSATHSQESLVWAWKHSALKIHP